MLSKIIDSDYQQIRGRKFHSAPCCFAYVHFNVSSQNNKERWISRIHQLSPTEMERRKIFVSVATHNGNGFSALWLS
jgi:hypothetical protein